MENNFAICLLSFDLNSQTKYNSYCEDLVIKLLANDFSNIYLLTNQSQKFEKYKINVIPIINQSYSYFDKITICKIALERYDQVLYIDCDSIVDFDKINKINEGFSFSQYWLGGKIKIFKDLTTHDTDYFVPIVEYCIKNNLKIDESPLIEERLFTLTKTENLDIFFKIYYDLKETFENNDIARGNYPVGRAEGLAIGIALINSGIKYNEIDHTLTKLNLKHLPNE